MLDAVHMIFSFRELTKSGNKNCASRVFLVPCIMSHMRFWSFSSMDIDFCNFVTD